MRLVIQRVDHARVEVEGEITGQIGTGLMLLVGITEGDADADIDFLVRKVINMRIFNDDAGKMNASVQDVGGDLLVISQFTLYADCKKGNRPSYIRSARPDFAIPMYEKFLTKLRENFPGKVEAGIFGAHMEVSLLNNGPVTIILDSKEPSF